MEKLNDEEYEKFMRWLHFQKIDTFKDSQLRIAALFSRKHSTFEHILHEIKKGNYQKALEKTADLCKD